MHDAGWTWLIEVSRESEVRAARPDFAAMTGRCGSAIITARSDDPAYDFVSRFFAPALGINEDPVTGSAHCVLAPFWGERLGKTALVGRQVSARGGVVKVALAGERVRLGGQSLTVFIGYLSDEASLVCLQAAGPARRESKCKTP